MREINAQTLEKQAHKLELQAATAHLLTHLLVSNGLAHAALGRYSFLTKIIQQRPELFKSLLDQDPQTIQSQWAQVLTDHKADIEFLHGLAVLFRERALDGSANGQSNEQHWVLGTTLWVTLLCTPQFWKYFTQIHTEGGQVRGQVSLDPESQNKLFDSAMRGVVSLHSEHGRRHYAAMRYDQASMHLYCLDSYRTGDTALIRALNKVGVPYNLTLDKTLLEQVSALAADLLDDWGSALVREAEKATEDAETIKRLPSGIRNNYEGGIGHLEQFIKLKVPVTHILRTSLRWYNDWCFDLYVTKDVQRLKTLLQSARLVADQLTPLCTKMQGHIPENQLLSQHFLFRGYTNDAPEQASTEFEEALVWNPANENAQTLLQGARRNILYGQLHAAIEHADQKRFDEAHRILSTVANQELDKQAVQAARAGVCFRQAQALAYEGNYRQALQRANEAQQLAPEQTVIVDFLKEMKSLAPEEANLRSLRAAQEALNQTEYDQSIRHASQVVTKSKYYGEARRVQSAAHFQRGVAAFQAQRFDQAAADLRRSLELNDNAEDRKIITTQLGVIQQNLLFYQAKQAAERGNWQQATQILRTAVTNSKTSGEKQEIEHQLAAVLNRHAVSLLSEAQAIEHDLGQVLTDIVTRVKQHLESGQSAGSGFAWTMQCPVCNSDSKSREVIVSRVLELVRSKGRFEVGGLIEFWQNFRVQLCDRCQAKLDSIPAKQQQALRLLEEAIKLDRSSDAIKKNLEVVRKLV